MAAPVHCRVVSEEEQQAGAERVAQVFTQGVPHNKALGMIIDAMGEDWAETRLEYREAFLGDTEAGIWHTGPAISLADTTCGLAVMLALPGIESIATLDLRMDYLRPALAEAPLLARGECYHITRRVAFVRGTLHQGDPTRPTAICTSAFMRTSRDRSAPDGGVA